MKLLYCSKCDGVVRLVQERVRYCGCGAAYGRYIDEQVVKYGGSGATPFVIANDEFQFAALNRQEGLPGPFTGWVPATDDRLWLYQS